MTMATQRDDDDRIDAQEAAPPPPAGMTPDPNDVLEVPPMMYPAELDARGDAVNALREEQGLPVPKTNDEDRGASYA
jgi:hypothetical protein